MSAVPALVTDRLLLRGFEPRDADTYAAMMADPDVTRFLGDGKPLDHVAAWRQLALIIGHWTLRGFGLWAVEDRATGALLGRVGCLEPPGWPGFEVGWVLAREHWGKGYATEAGAASLRYARDVLARDRVISIIRPGNATSIRVAERLGGTSEGGHHLRRGTDAHLYVSSSRAGRPSRASVRIVQFRKVLDSAR